MIGKTISHYKVTEKLGEGGMGVVYKAEDTKLNRSVALKFLPTNQLGTTEDKQRFQQEAKAAAQLSHANIATVYEINEHDGETFIAMEYIDGETIAEKAKKRPLKIKDAMKIAKQIAEGLHSAHELGIVHRDIKSANIMITSKGIVKIMDFGLAKMSTVSKLTKAGTTVGTVSYMSPEQSQGEKVDHRSDIWSLGVVFYEMISGQLPFKGDYESAVVYSIINEPPEPLTAVRTGVPMDLEKIVNKLLAKDPDDRYQNIIELPVDLKNVSVQDTGASQIGSSIITDTISTEKELSVKVKYSYKTILIIVATALFTFLLTWLLQPGPTPPEPERMNNMAVSLPENTSLLFSGFNRMAISPDGKDIVYLGFDRESVRRLFLKRAGSFAPIELEGIADARAPFFSPDGRWIGYLDRESDEINKVLVDGGGPLKVTSYQSSHNYSSATWGPNNTIIFTDDNVLKRVSESGGEPTILTKTESQTEQHLFPHMLPDGKTVLFTIAPQARELSTYRLAVYSFGDDDYRVILDEEGYNAVYAHSGHILYGRSEKLMGVAFNLENLKVRGIPAPVLDNVQTRESGSMSYALSKEGTIIYVPATGSDDELSSVWNVDLTGNPSEFFDLKKDFRFARYSPDGKYAAFGIDEKDDYNIWIYHIDGGALNQLTFYKGNTSSQFVWSPDSKTIAYATIAEDSSNSIYVRNIDGTGTARKIYTSSLNTHMYVKDWSSDGKMLAFHQNNGEFSWDIFVYSFEDSSAKPYLSSPAFEAEPQFSPNGKWILYESGESGFDEVYVRPYPESTGGVWKISNGGGDKPLWSPDGKKIYYENREELYSVDVTSGDVFSKSNPQKIFKGNYFLSYDRRFDIHPDGDRFIMIQRREVTQQNQIFVIQNFSEELKRLVPVKKDM